MRPQRAFKKNRTFIFAMIILSDIYEVTITDNVSFETNFRLSIESKRILLP